MFAFVLAAVPALAMLELGMLSLRDLVHDRDGPSVRDQLPSK